MTLKKPSASSKSYNPTPHEFVVHNHSAEKLKQLVEQYDKFIKSDVDGYIRPNFLQASENINPQVMLILPLQPQAQSKSAIVLFVMVQGMYNLERNAITQKSIARCEPSSQNVSERSINVVYLKSIVHPTLGAVTFLSYLCTKHCQISLNLT